MNMTVVADDQSTIYARLAAPFDKTTEVNGFDTITAEQCTTRLLEVLGPFGWSFFIKEHGIHAESDTIWALGRLEIYPPNGQPVVREQFGSQKINRYTKGPNVGQVIDLANDLMGAGTGAMKKCASLFGVALYLRVKKPFGSQRRDDWVRQQEEPRAARPARQDGPVPVILCKQPTGERDNAGKLVLCGNRLEAVPEREWAVGQLANAGLALASHPLCWACFQAAEQRKAG